MLMLDAALELAALGWEVLPLRGKVPITKRGLHDASTDPERVRDWWGTGAHNIGARVPNLLIVLDVDPQNGGDFAALEAIAQVPLPTTLTVHSGRGTGGQHRYYLHPGGTLTARNLPQGIDLKTHTGYCVMPPSLHPATGKPYSWTNTASPAALPTEVAHLLRRQPRPQPAPYPNNKPLPANVIERKAAYLARFVAGAPEGERNRVLYWAACRMVEDRHPEASFTVLVSAAQHAGLTATEALETINSARRGGAA